MSDFDHPASGLEVRIALYFFALFASGTDMGSVLTLLNGLGAASIASIQAKILCDGIHRYFQEWQAAGFFENIWVLGLEKYDELEGIGWKWQSVFSLLYRRILLELLGIPYCSYEAQLNEAAALCREQPLRLRAGSRNTRIRPSQRGRPAGDRPRTP